MENETLTSNSSDLSLYKPIPIIFWTFLSVETILIVIGNGMLCWLFFSHRNLRTQQNYFVLSLSVSDLLVGLTVAPCEYCALRTDTHINIDCPVFCGSVVSFNMLASTINLVLIAADRYYSINRPFRYQEVLTKRRVVIIIAVGWVTTLVLTMLPLTWVLTKTSTMVNTIFMETLFAIIFLVGVLLGMSYYKIVNTVKSKLRLSKEKSSNPAGIKVCILVAISFFVSWIPMCIVEVLLQNSMKVPPQVINAAYFILLMNPCLDPIMYAYYRKDFRHELASWSRRQWKSIKTLYNGLFPHSHGTKESMLNNSNKWNNNNGVDALIKRSALSDTSVGLTTVFLYSTTNGFIDSTGDQVTPL